MNQLVFTDKNKRIENTICALYPSIERQITNTKLPDWTEYSLRRELVACILGSQVRLEMATIALNRIEKCGLLDDKWWNHHKSHFEVVLFGVLTGQNPKAEKQWSYRFPQMRAQQLAKTRDALLQLSLKDRISQSIDPKQIRKQLITDIAGLGPKQASMFLRNIGLSYELAILDTHVLRFMNMQNLISIANINISNIPAYERTERIVSTYAKKLGYRVGYLDWAIWATMRAAMEIGL